MCVAVYSPKGNNIPSESYLRSCWKGNPDGAGIAYNDAGRVRILKGFMTWDAFKSTLDSLNETLDLKNRGVLLHFRIATHGGINPECTHPFPLIADYSVMKMTESYAEYAVIHNGIISLTADTARKLDHISDTMVFVNKYISKIASNKDWFENQSNWDLIHDLADSKIAILKGDGEIKSTPGFHQAEDGNFYSNYSYYNYQAKSTPSYGYTYDVDDDIVYQLPADYNIFPEDARRVFGKDYFAEDDDSIYLNNGFIDRHTGKYVSYDGTKPDKSTKKKVKQLKKLARKEAVTREPKRLKVMEIDPTKYALLFEDGEIYSAEGVYLDAEGQVYAAADNKYNERIKYVWLADHADLIEANSSSITVVNPMFIPTKEISQDEIM